MAWHGILMYINSNALLNQNQTAMENLLYIIALILVIGWAIGFFAYHVGGIIHILLVIAIISILLRVIRGKDPV